jgi:ribonuclease P protein component
LLREGRRLSGRHLQLVAAPAARNSGRIGYIIARQHLPRAVDRNYVRRILREALRSRRPAVLHYDIVVRLRVRCARAALRDLATETADLLDALVTSNSQ